MKADAKEGFERRVEGLQNTQSVCPFVGIGSPHPLPQKDVCPPLDPKREGEQHSLAGEGVKGPNSDDWTESLALCILYGFEQVLAMEI
jgi:hypothetical protein